MVVSNEPLWQDAVDNFVREDDEAVVYADRETILHEGPVRLLGNGWVELPTGRLLSPRAVHHIDRCE
jgi:hypothetical protein